MGPGWGWILFESDQLPSNHLQASVLAQRCQEAHHGRQGARTGWVLGAGPPPLPALKVNWGFELRASGVLVRTRKEVYSILAQDR